MTPAEDSWNGALILDKPEGITSHDVVDAVRRATGTRRVGHCGTLDPFATGVLVVLVGQATRLQRFLMNREKVYRARIRFGYATDTQDRTGKPLEAGVASNLDVEGRLESILREFLGAQEQVAPMYSAKKIAGQPLYRKARQGEEVERKPHAIRIDDIRLLPVADAGAGPNPDGTLDREIEVTCSAGTYVRTLAHDLGHRLGCGGHLRELRRLRSGSFRVEHALTLAELNEAGASGKLCDRLVPMGGIDLAMSELVLSAGQADSIRHGQAIAIDTYHPGTFWKLVSSDGRLLGVGEAAEEGGTIQPRIVLD